MRTKLRRLRWLFWTRIAAFAVRRAEQCEREMSDG